MKKQTKLFTTLSAAALLTIGVSAVSMAAGWDNSTGEWRYLNNDGTEVTDTWKSANGNWFYLGSDGVMATNQLIEDNNNSTTRYYYVDQYGAMVKNTWKAVARDDSSEDVNAEYWWYYFGNDGKAYTTKNDKDKLSSSQIKTINGLKYAFDDEGHMLYGWIKDDSLEQNDSDEKAWKDATYFFNGWNDGHMQTGWANLTVEDDDETKEYWFYFGNDGKKVGNKEGKRKKINGAYYHFADDGHMITDWAVGTQSIEDASGATASDVKYLNGDGSERKNKWVWAVPDEYSKNVATALQNDYDDDEYSWWYFDKGGKMIVNKIKKINGKKYAFDQYGRMVIGFVAENPDGSIVALKKPGDYEIDKLRRATALWKLSDDTSDAIALDSDAKIYFFGTNEEKDGSMKKGYQTLELDDTSAQFYFHASQGYAENGYVDKINKFCLNGLVLSATSDDDSNYGLVTTDDDLSSTEIKEVDPTGILFNKTGSAVDGKTIMVNSSGSLVKGKNKLKDNNDNYYIVNKQGIVLRSFPSEDSYNNFLKYKDDKKISITSDMLELKTVSEFNAAVQAAKDEKLKK